MQMYQSGDLPFAVRGEFPRATSNWLYALIDPRTAEDPFLRPLAAALVQRFFH